SAPAQTGDAAASGRGSGAGAPRRESPRLATTALLFQAPEPTSRPRRRRVESPAGPPRLEDLVLPGDEAPEEDAEELAVEAGLVTPEVAPAEEAATEEAAGADQDGADEDGTDDDGPEADDESGAPRRRRRRGGRGRRSRSGAERDGDDADEAATADESGEDDAETAGSEPEGEDEPREGGRRRRRSGRGRGQAEPGTGDDAADESSEDDENGENGDEGQDEGDEQGGASSRRRRRRRRARGEGDDVAAPARTRTRAARTPSDEVTALKGSTRLEAKRQRRREGRDAGRRRTIVTESEFLARREAVDRAMIVRESDGRVQIAVLEDGVLVEHFVSRTGGQGAGSMAGNVYLGRVQNVLPSMEAAFVDVGKGRNAVLYAGEVNWDAAGLEGQPRRIEQALKSGDSVLVQVTKDPIGHKGARLTSQITLAGRYLVYVPAGGMTGISRKLPENERARLKKLLKEIVPDAAGVIVRTAAEGASEEELRADVQRLQDQWAAIEKKAKSASAPALLHGEPDLAIRVVRDIFNDDFSSLVVQGDGVWSMISEYVGAMAPDLVEKVSRWSGQGDVFGAHRIDEQLAKGMDRKVYLPSGGSLVIDRTEAMTVVDVNTGKFTGSGGTLEETVTRNNLEAAEEIVRQLRLRDIGGIIVIDFIDMVLESNRDLVLRRLVECLGRDRTKHQVAEVTSLGLVQMTRKRVGQGLVEAFSETCQHCNGRGFIVHSEPVEVRAAQDEGRPAEPTESKRSRRKKAAPAAAPVAVPVLPQAREAVKATLATIAAAAAHAHDHDQDQAELDLTGTDDAPQDRASDGAAPETAPEAAAEAATQDAPAADDLGDALASIEAVEAPVAPVTDDAREG
ncbi:Rne/Rng family ribonuclease, partial [Actinotalea sp. JY-7885]